MIFTLSCVYTLICFLIEKITKGKKPLCEFVGVHIYGWTDLSDQHWKCLQKSLLILMYFTCNIYRGKWFHIEKKSAVSKKTLPSCSLEWNAVKNFCELVRLEYMQIFPAARQTSTSRSGCGGGGGEVLYDCLDRSVLCDPRTLSLYHSMFSSNFASLAILEVCLWYVCKKKQRKKPTLCELSATLHGTNPVCFNV